MLDPLRFIKSLNKILAEVEKSFWQASSKGASLPAGQRNRHQLRPTEKMLVAQPAHYTANGVQCMLALTVYVSL